MKKQQLIPKLRFSEFEGEWEKKNLGEVAIFLDEKRKPIKSSDRNKMKGKYPYYGASGVIDYVNNFIFDDELILLGEDGENIISRNSPLAFRVSGKCWINNHAHVIKPKKETNIDFLTTNLERVNYVIYNTGTAQPKLNKAVCSSIPTYFPSFSEQQKIANFLTAIDNQTQTLEKKKSLLAQYKKGIIQKIFKQELRFKDEDGNYFPEWEERKLGEISKIKTGKLDANAMVENGKYRFYTCAKDFYLIDDYAFDTDALLISGNGANVGYIHHYKGKFNAYQRTYILDSFKEEIIYIKYYLNKFLSDRINREKKDGNTPYIVLSTLKDMTIGLPVIKEQTKIAKFLSAIDKNIAIVNTKIEQTKGYKKGVLQQMFV